MGIAYVTREEVLAALGAEGTKESLSSKKVDSVIESASRSVEKLTKRIFYPEIKTKLFDYPQNSTGWRLWFESPEELISATAVSSGGVTIASTDYFLEPYNYGPPYNRLELDFASNAAFETTETTQRQISITGTWGYNNQTQTVATLSAGINASVVSVSVSDVSDIGVGSLIKVSDEVMQVTDKSWVDSGQNTSALTLALASQTITGITAGTINQYETILIDSERMLVTEVAGTTLTVTRAYGGTTLAAHALNADIYVLRTLTVIRGVLGTTAASHSSADVVSVITFPGPVTELVLAEAINSFKQRTDGYARTVGSGENQREGTGRALSELRKSVKSGYGRIKVGAI